jgi:transposase InsO family protein
MSFALIDQMQRREILVAQSCRMLGVNRSDYYEARCRLAQPAICTDSVHVRAVFAANQWCYGSRRMVIALREKGLKIGRYRVRRLMRQSNLKPVWKREFVHTTDSKHSHPVAEKIISRQFNVCVPIRRT